MKTRTPDGSEPKNPTLEVLLVQVGESFDYDVTSLAKKLNGRNVKWLNFKSKILEVQDLSDYDLVETLQLGQSPYWDCKKAMDILQNAVPVDSNTLVIGITPGWLADDPGEGNEVNPKDAYFGVWFNRYVPDYGSVNHAIISTSMWQSKYERVAYRDVNQYIIHCIVAAIGDYIVEKVDAVNESWPGLTHAIFQNCTFDYTPDLDSIVPAVQRSRICERCKKRLQSTKAELRISTPPQAIIAGLERLLEMSRVPPNDQVFRALQEDPRFSIIAISCLLSLFVGIIGQMISSSTMVGAGISVLCLTALVLIWWRKRQSLTGRVLP